jgi:Transposase DDE domain
VIVNIIKSTVANVLLDPVFALLSFCSNLRSCTQLSDSDWIVMGIHRVLHENKSGRAFLQQHAFRFDSDPSLSLYFESLKSSRRLSLVEELNIQICKHAKSELPDPLAQFSDLNNFDVYAGDGHWHAAAAHDLRNDKGSKYATGNFVAHNLRHHTVTHLAVGQGEKEHDMHVLKRLEIDRLRQGAPKHRKVLYVWDKACIDFHAWYHWKNNHGIYFISLQKSNANLTRCGDLPFDKTDPMNHGILSDEQVGCAAGMMIRRITYINPVDNVVYVVLTNEMTIRPGLIVFLYKSRWDIEKFFDEKKNKLEEKKSWATSLTAKAIQMEFICLTHNLMLLLEAKLEKEGIRNEAENKRRAERLDEAREQARKNGGKLPSPLELVIRATSRSVKLIRWIRSYLLDNTPWADATPRLRLLYSKL